MLERQAAFGLAEALADAGFDVNLYGRAKTPEDRSVVHTHYPEGWRVAIEGPSTLDGTLLARLTLIGAEHGCQIIMAPVGGGLWLQPVEERHPIDARLMDAAHEAVQD